jgi:hypothetical protein
MTTAPDHGKKVLPMRALAERPSSRTPRRPARPTVATPEPSPRVVVRKSSIQGRGVFAIADIAEGERIVEYTGERITHEEAGRRYDDEAVRRHHTFLFSIDDDVCVDGGRGGNESRFINHSCEPNAHSVVQKKRIHIVALRAIEAGEEVVYDYWYSTDDTYTDEDRRRLYPCRCGAATCRGTLAAPQKKKVATKAKRRHPRNGSR